MQAGVPRLRKALTFTIFQDVGGKASLVTHIGSIFAVFLLDDALEVVIDFGPDAHGIAEAFSSHRQDHELLHGQFVACVGTSVDHVESLEESARASELKEPVLAPPRGGSQMSHHAHSRLIPQGNTTHPLQGLRPEAYKPRVFLLTVAQSKWLERPFPPVSPSEISRDLYRSYTNKYLSVLFTCMFLRATLCQSLPRPSSLTLAKF